MALPVYAAEASLYITSRFYRGARSGRADDAGPTIVAQQDPCAIGGGRPPPPPPPTCKRAGVVCQLGAECCAGLACLPSGLGGLKTCQN